VVGVHLRRPRGGYLIAARPLLERDRAELARRRYYYDRRELDPDQRPLAVGMAARELVERARRWAAAHPEHTYPVAPSMYGLGRCPDPASLGERATPLWVARSHSIDSSALWRAR